MLATSGSYVIQVTPLRPLSLTFCLLEPFEQPVLHLAQNSFFPTLHCGLSSNLQHVSGLFQLQDSLALDFGERISTKRVESTSALPMPCAGKCQA